MKFYSYFSLNTYYVSKLSDYILFIILYDVEI